MTSEVYYTRLKYLIAGMIYHSCDQNSIINNIGLDKNKSEVIISASLIDSITFELLNDIVKEYGLMLKIHASRGKIFINIYNWDYWVYGVYGDKYADRIPKIKKP